MKMILIICPDSRRGDIRELMEKHGVNAFTEMKEVTGEGETGKRFGTRVWPGKSSLIFAVVPDEQKDDVMGALRNCSIVLFPGEGLRVFVLPVEETV